MICKRCGKEGLHEITDMFDENKVHYLCEQAGKKSNNKYFIHEVDPTNPLREVPYWGRGDGQNLSAIHALEWAEAYVDQMNKELPCEENTIALVHIRLALQEQRNRMRLRKQQGVLGTNRPHKSEPGLPDVA